MTCRNKTNSLLTSLAAAALLVGACGDDDDSTTTAVGERDEVADEATGEETDAPDDAGDGTEDDVAAPSGGEGTAVVTLANGESFEFSVMCVLESQVAAGQEIAYSLTSYDEPVSFDATKFGEDAVTPGMATVSLYDAETYETLWDAADITGNQGLLERDGDTVTGSGTFFADGEAGMGEGVEGELEVSC